MVDLSSTFKGRWTIWIIALAFALLTAFGVLSILGRWADQRAYYVVSQDIPANYEITPDIVLELTTNVDGVPPTALTQADIAAGGLFSRLPLKAGDVLTSSVVGPAADPITQLPPGYVLATLKVAPERAVGGRVSVGDYIDIAAVQNLGDTSVAKVVLHHVLVLDVAVSPETIAEAANEDGSLVGPDSQANYNGFPEIYTLAVTPNAFLTLALIAESPVFIALTSPNATGPLDAIVNGNDLFKPGPVPGTGPIISDGSALASIAFPTEEELSKAVGKPVVYTEEIPSPSDQGIASLTKSFAENIEGDNPDSLSGGIGVYASEDLAVIAEGYRQSGAQVVEGEDYLIVTVKVSETQSAVYAFVVSSGKIASGTCLTSPAFDAVAAEECAKKIADLMAAAIPVPSPDPVVPSPSPSGAIPSGSAIPAPNSSLPPTPSARAS